MIDIFLQMSIELQIFCLITMLIGLGIMWRFKYYVLVIAAGAAAMWYKASNRKK